MRAPHLDDSVWLPSDAFLVSCLSGNPSVFLPDFELRLREFCCRSACRRCCLARSSPTSGGNISNRPESKSVAAGWPHHPPPPPPHPHTQVVIVQKYKYKQSANTETNTKPNTNTKKERWRHGLTILHHCLLILIHRSSFSIVQKYKYKKENKCKNKKGMVASPSSTTTSSPSFTGRHSP